MPTTGYEIELMKKVRGFTLDAIKDLSKDQLLAVPAGFNNNALWNVGHLLYEQCVFMYGLTQQPFPLPAGCEERYQKMFDDGTAPKTWDAPPDVDAILKQFAAITDTIASDAAAGKFNGFKPVELFPGMTLHSFQEAVVFHAIHEGMHYGTIGALKRFLK